MTKCIEFIRIRSYPGDKLVPESLSGTKEWSLTRFSWFTPDDLTSFAFCYEHLPSWTVYTAAFGVYWVKDYLWISISRLHNNLRLWDKHEFQTSGKASLVCITPSPVLFWVFRKRQSFPSVLQSLKSKWLHFLDWQSSLQRFYHLLCRILENCIRFLSSVQNQNFENLIAVAVTHYVWHS